MKACTELHAGHVNNLHAELRNLPLNTQNFPHVDKEASGLKEKKRLD